MEYNSDSEPEPELTPMELRRIHDRPQSWFVVLKRYIQETDVSSINLSSMRLKTPEVTTILEFLADSHVTELDLSDNNLKNGLESLSKLLIQTKVKKLNVRACHLKRRDTLSLMKVLKNTQITDLDISDNHIADFYEDNNSMFISHLVESRLTVLNLSEILMLNKDEVVLPFIQALRNTSLTHLNLKGDFCPAFNHESLLSLFFELKHTLITHLNLADCSTGECDFTRLGDSLRDSNLVELDLSGNHIWDRNVDDLFRALIGSKIMSLSLASNPNIYGNNNLGHFLKDTQITHLDLSGLSNIEKPDMFSFPDFIRGSAVESLKLSGCNLTDAIGVPLMRSFRFSNLKHLDVSENELHFISIAVFAGVLKDTSITSFNFSDNYNHDDDELLDEGLQLIGELSVGTSLQHLDLSDGFHGLSYFSFNVPIVLADFFGRLGNAPITSLNLGNFACFGLEGTEAERLVPFLAKTQLTHLNLENNNIGDGVLSLAANLKSTAITHLNLSQNIINDEGAKALAECLKETRIIDLDLSCNNITCLGATDLALFLRDVVVFNLNLNWNNIENKGLEAFAKYIEPNLLTNVEIKWNFGNPFKVETVILNNRRIVHQLVSFFKRIAPETINDGLQFEQLATTSNIDTFLEECLQFYKLAIEQPSTADVLAHEESISLSRDEIASLLLDEFPKQFAWFIFHKIEANTSEQVNFLRRVEELGLRKIVELLLVNRPVYTINETHGILHPYVYELLIKYKLPVCNLGIEPQGIERIVKYFTTFANIEGAAEIFSILKNLNEKTDNAGGLPGTSDSAGPSNEWRTAMKRKREV